MSITRFISLFYFTESDEGQGLELQYSTTQIDPIHSKNTSILFVSISEKLLSSRIGNGKLY